MFKSILNFVLTPFRWIGNFFSWITGSGKKVVNDCFDESDLSKKADKCMDAGKEAFKATFKSDDDKKEGNNKNPDGK